MNARQTDQQWYKDAIIYELSVRSFYDSNGDGIGDFQGLIQKLDYLEDLGVTAIWLLPFYPSPLKDDGYDVTSHIDVHPDYGTLADFKQFLKEAHARGIRVITELILNHTSDQHPWFKKAKRSKEGTRLRDYYVWSDTPEKYKEARVLFSEESSTNWSWDNEAKAYYWHRFRSYQPELNFENPEVQLELTKVVDFWLKLGVDGFRLSSIAFLYEEENTNCENLPQTHAFLRRLRAYIDKHYKHRVLLAEANLWPEDAATYFGKESDECHMSFYFPLMPRLFLGLRTEDSYPIVDIMEQTPALSEASQWALFLRNHDELGLDMVTDEEKDYLFKAYATDSSSKYNKGIRRRLAPMLDNDRRKIELLHTLLFSLPGTPILYYGDEIGMGDNVYLGDRFGVRTPMQWNMNLNAGFSSANPQKLHLPVITDPVYRYESVNVATQEENTSSLIWWMKQVMAMRKRLNVFGRGSMQFIESSNAKVLCFARKHDKQTVIVVANLSQFSQYTTLKLTEYKDCDVTEVFSQNRFMNVGEGEYALTIGPYGYFWLQVDVAEKPKTGETQADLYFHKTEISWERLLTNYNEVRVFERKVFPGFMRKCRWFGGKAKVVTKVSVSRIIPVKVDGTSYYFVVLEVSYAQRLPELYFVPLSFTPADSVVDQVDFTPQSVLCRIEIQGKSGFVIDASYDRAFRNFLFAGMEKGMRVKTEEGLLEFNNSVYAKLNSKNGIDSKILKSDQSNTAIIYNDEYFFKFYRRIENEINPDLEVLRFLSESTSFANSPRYSGSVEFKDNTGKVMVFGLMQVKVENQGEAWGMAVDSVGRFFERVMTKAKNEKLPKLINKPAIKFDEAPEIIQEFIGRGFYERVVRLGQRTAEMHLALASDNQDPSFAPEPFTTNYQRALYASLRKLVRDRFNLLEGSLHKLDKESQALAKKVMGLENTILDCFKEIYEVRIDAIKTRIHGDYHLGQVLFTGKDFVIIDFEGEPGFSFSERRLKKNPFKDVAGMMRSFHYAAFGKILLNENYRDRDLEFLEAWAEQWQHYVGRFYLGAYMERMGMGTELTEEYDTLIRTFLIEKAIYELGYELNGRPDWTIIPLRGIDYLINRYIGEKEEKSKKKKSKS